MLAAFLALSVGSIALAQAPPAPTPPAGSGDGSGCHWYDPRTYGVCAIQGLSALLATLLTVFISLGKFLTDFALSLNKELVNLPIVQTGFGITLAIANLGFVLAIIVIAIATILRLESYGLKQTLWRLIVMALLVNFGLVICGVILNTADQFTNTFLAQASPGGTATGLTDALKAGFRDQELWKPPPTAAPTGSKLDDTWRTLMDAFVRNLFLAVIALVFFALAVMLTVRFIYLSLLLILLPLAWLCWIFPGTKQYFDMWWKKFIQWTIFAPITVFFLYLALLTSNTMSQNATIQASQPGAVAGTAGGAAAATVGRGNQQESYLRTLAQILLLSGLALGGLLAANSLGIMGASAALGLGKAAGKWVGGAVGAGSVAAGRGAGRFAGRTIADRLRTAGTQYNPATRETTTAVQRLGSRLQAVPGLRGIGSYVAKQGTIVAKKRPEDVEKYRKDELMNLDNEAVISRATSRTAFVDPMKSAAIGQELARRNITNDPRVAGRMNQFVQVAEQMGSAQGIYNNRPDLIAARPGESRNDAVARATRGTGVTNIAQIAHETLGDHANAAAAPTADQTNVVLNISNPQLGRLGTEGDHRQIEAIRNTMTQLAANIAALTPQQQAQVNRVRDFINNNPNWQNIP